MTTPEERQAALVEKMKYNKSERTLFNAGRHLTLELLKGNTLKPDYIRYYIERTFPKPEQKEYVNGALKELELWT